MGKSEIGRYFALHLLYTYCNHYTAWNWFLGILLRATAVSRFRLYANESRKQTGETGAEKAPRAVISFLVKGGPLTPNFDTRTLTREL